ncbi:MAG TPA: class IV lanthionine synthetase LanL [Mycobacteriales bacterium]|nr:class IV lanthionine synthetase LanL [Mycobacteriales bacterium]
MLAADPAGGWSVTASGMWAVARPAGHRFRAQGWKLHLSATPLSIPDVLTRAVPVLRAAGSAFKFPGSADAVDRLNGRSCPRGTAGKYVTVYPRDDEQFRVLAELLDRATAGLPGPEILSDRPYRGGSVVHYRYGGFTASTVLDDDGCYRPMILDPAGRLVEDRRDAWFAPPSWAPAPWPETDEPAPAGDVPAQVLLDDRFLVQDAIRHSSRGGLFRARDLRTGAPVVIKQARAHMEVDPTGRDCRDRLRHEADLYGRLAPTGIVPRFVTLVEDGANLFLVRQLMDGTTLRAWVTAQADTGGVAPESGLRMAGALVRLLETVHRAGLVLVDVSPNNIVVDPAGTLWLIDPDNAVEAGRPVWPVGTPGYTPPEHQQDGLVPGRPEADLFGLGGLLFLIAVGADPVLAADSAPERPASARLQAWLARIGPELPLAYRLAAPILGLTHQDPDRRWSLERVRRHLAGSATPGPSGSSVRPDRPGVSRLIEDAVGWLRATMDPAGERLWAAGRSAPDADPCAVQHGAAGVLAALVAAAPHVTDPAPVRDTIESACGWLVRQLPHEPRLLPGLYFGRSGTAWALFDAARLLGDPRLAGRALDLAARLPLRWPNADVAHGAAGAGLAQLHLWLAGGDPLFLARARACADGLAAAARRTDGHLLWPIPGTLRSGLAGQTHLGYAHGTAGIGDFLLAAGTATGDSRYVALARDAADTLAATAVRRGAEASWPARPGGGCSTGAGWCAGSAGIGTFLLHAGQALADPRLIELAAAAAVAVSRSAPRTNPAACHGLAGGGQFLLDLADALGEPDHRRRAEDLAALMVARAAGRGGRLLVPDETGLGVAADHGIGLAGVASFLVRLQHGGAAPWTVTPFSSPCRHAHGAAPIHRRDCHDHCP